MFAAEKGHADVVQLLLSAGANIEAADKVILMIHYCMVLISFVVRIIIFCRIEIINRLLLISIMNRRNS